MRCGYGLRQFIFAMVASLSIAVLFAPSAYALDETPHEKPTTDAKATPAKSAPDTHKDDKPKVFTQEFSGTFNGSHLTYAATARETFLRNDKGDNTASIFSVAYTKKNAGPPENRPVTFIFNGGPGSASLWLHLGVFGPKAIVFPHDDSGPGAAPYKVEDNAVSILDITDLVFIDPVGSGYSHAMGDAKDEDFWGLAADADSIANFIRRWLSENGRWNSPKYLAGESYGTTRAARLAADLQNGYDGVYLNGVILISSILDFHTIGFEPGNDLPFITYLPTYAAAAWYHGKVEPRPEKLSDFLQEVRTFAQTDYAVALMKGSELSEGERRAVAKRLARYTGLSEDYIVQANLRIHASRFMKQLLRDREQVVGRYDARIIGTDYDAAGETPDGDPALYTVDGAFVAATNDYLTRALKVNIDRHYKILEGGPSSSWKWYDHQGPGTYVNVATGLGQAMRQNTDLRVLACSGLFDLATPFFATELTLTHNSIPRDRVTLTYYDAGHMMYTHRPSREALAKDVHAFIAAGGGKPSR